MDNTTESRKGADACMEALRALENIAECNSSDTEMTTNEYLARMNEATQAVVNAAGTLPPFLGGFVETLVQYIHDSLVVGTPNLYVWKPAAAMTDQELAEHRLMLAGGEA